MFDCQRLQDVASLPEKRLIDVRRRGRVGPDGKVEGREAPRVDRVETGVAEIGVLDDVPHEAVVVQHRETHPVGIALVLRQRAFADLPRILRRQLAVRTDADRIERGRVLLPIHPRIFTKLHQAWIPAVEHPPFGDRQNRLAFLADVAKVANEILKRFERGALALSRDHLGGQRRLEGFV